MNAVRLIGTLMLPIADLVAHVFAACAIPQVAEEIVDGIVIGVKYLKANGALPNEGAHYQSVNLGVVATIVMQGHSEMPGWHGVQCQHAASSGVLATNRVNAAMA